MQENYLIKDIYNGFVFLVYFSFPIFLKNALVLEDPTKIYIIILNFDIFYLFYYLKELISIFILKYFFYKIIRSEIVEILNLNREFKILKLNNILNSILFISNFLFATFRIKYKIFAKTRILKKYNKEFDIERAIDYMYDMSNLLRVLIKVNKFNNLINLVLIGRFKLLDILFLISIIKIVEIKNQKFRNPCFSISFNFRLICFGFNFFEFNDNFIDVFKLGVSYFIGILLFNL